MPITARTIVAQNATIVQPELRMTGRQRADRTITALVERSATKYIRLAPCAL